MPIGLAPTARSSFEAHDIDHAAMDSAPLLDLPFNPGVKIRGYSAINQPNCQIIIEDFMPGDEFDWVFVHDEMQYCLSGEMEVTVYLPPLYSEVIKARIKPGTIYSYPVGARKHVKVIGDEPFRHICFCPPSPNYPFPTLSELKKAQKKPAKSAAKPKAKPKTR
jgi:quercetin dioxygenase-like cupin family protein